MADDCSALGFEMDCGHAFERVYGKAASNCEQLDKIIDDVTDIPLLGSAIYSQWRYFNHWAYDGAEILKPKNRAWFIVALSRLALLTGENPFIFEGIPKKIRIVSNGMGYGPCPEPNDIVEQHITINSDGNNKPDVINRIVLDYHRLTKIKTKEVSEDAAWEFVSWDYTEQLILNRETETLEHIQNIGTGCKVSRKYEIKGGIESLLDDFEEFADTVFDFMRFYGLGEILDPSVYGKVKRRTTDHIFCSVTFDEGQNPTII